VNRFGKHIRSRKPIQKIKPVIIQEESEIVTENKPHDIIKPKLPKKKRSKSAREVGNRNLDDDQNEQNLVRNDSQRKKNQARAALLKLEYLDTPFMNFSYLLSCV
jgi:hypothetical protein